MHQLLRSVADEVQETVIISSLACPYVDGLVWDYNISNANAMEILQLSMKPSMYDMSTWGLNASTRNMKSILAIRIAFQ